MNSCQDMVLRVTSQRGWIYGESSSSDLKSLLGCCTAVTSYYQGPASLFPKCDITCCCFPYPLMLKTQTAVHSLVIPPNVYLQVVPHNFSRAFKNRMGPFHCSEFGQV